MFMTLFMLMLLQGLASSEEENRNNPMSCYEILENQERRNFTDVIPKGWEILFKCPVVKEYTDCLIRTVSETELNFELDDLFSVRSFLNDMCDVTSQLYQGYVNNFECFKSMMNEWYGCKEIASGVIEEFSKTSYAFQSFDLGDFYVVEQEDIREYQILTESHCLLNAHTFACIGMKMQETCGQGAYETYVEIMRRGRFTSEFCDRYALKYFMKGYLLYLWLENKPTEIEIIADLFNVETD